MSKCAGAEREHSQTASLRWPMEILHTIDVMFGFEGGLARGQESPLLPEYNLVLAAQNFP